jgi:hypothetical protein
VLRQFDVGVQELGRHPPGHGSAPGPLALWNAAVGFAQNVRCLECVPLVGAHRHSPGHGGTLRPLALLECSGRLRTVWVAWCVCVPMVGAHWYSPGHGSALGPLALLECGGQLRTECVLLGVCVCLWSAHTGTRLVTAVPSGCWHCWNAAVRFAQRVRCLVGVCAYGRRTPALAWSRAMPLGRWHCWNAAVGFAQYVRCLVPCVPMVGAHRCSPVRTVDSVIVLRKGAGVGANAASIVYARIAGLGGCAAGPAACVLLSSETGSSGLRAAHGGSRRCGGGIS